MQQTIPASFGTGGCFNAGRVVLQPGRTTQQMHLAAKTFGQVHASSAMCRYCWRAECLPQP